MILKVPPYDYKRSRKLSLEEAVRVAVFQIGSINHFVKPALYKLTLFEPLLVFLSTSYLTQLDILFLHVLHS